jgi:hypothetical protein
VDTAVGLERCLWIQFNVFNPWNSATVDTLKRLFIGLGLDFLEKGGTWLCSFS